MRSRRVELSAPASKIIERLRLQLVLEFRPLERIQLRRRKQGIDERFDVEAGPANDYGLLVDLAGALHPFGGLGGPARSRVTLLRPGDIDPVVGDTFTFVAARLGGADIE